MGSENIEFTGRIGSGLCKHRCKICGQWAWWPSEQIQHAEKCPERELPKENSE